MKVYIDVLFIINLIMDFILLNITSEIMSVKLKPIRAAAAAAVGAAAGVCFFVFDLKNSAVYSAVGAALITAAAFCPCRPKELIKLVFSFYFSAAIACGIIYADMRLFGGGMIKNGVFYANSPRITLTAAAVWLAARLLAGRMKRRASKAFSAVILEYEGRRVKLCGFTDTGNGLCDPLSGQPVMLVDAAVLKKLVASDCTAENLCEWAESDRLRTIPYSSVDKEGAFCGLVLDYAYIDGKRIEKPTIAICSKRLKYPVILNTGMK